MCGMLQFLFFAIAVFVASYASIVAHMWITAAPSISSLYLRAVISAGAIFFGTSALLIAIKWLAVGRFTAQPIPIWSLAYVRFWIAKVAIQFNPLNLLVGTPLYSTYLRLLGVQIGKNSLVFARPPVCADLVSIGDNTIIRQDCFLSGYTASSGYLYLGNVTIGSGAFVAEASVLDINTRIGNDAQLGTSSALLEGQSIPDDMIYQGSPAVPSNTDFDRVPPIKLSMTQRSTYVCCQLLWHFFITLPVPIIGLVLLIHSGFSAVVPHSVGPTEVIRYSLGYAAVLYVGGLVAGLCVITTLPRMLNLFVVPEKVYPLFGFQYFLANAINRLSNSRVLNTIFGDSSLIVYYLSAIGYDLSESTQTGSNFGVSQRHHSPILCQFSRNTLVSDGLVVLNMEMSSTSFRMRRVSVAADNYLGNLIHYPADSQIGPNCLIATKAMVPIDGPLRSGVGILGSPPFEIPRSVLRDRRFDHYKEPKVLKQRLKMKLRSNLITLAYYLIRNWLEQALLIAISLMAFVAIAITADTPMWLDAMTMTCVVLLALFVTPAFSIMFERGVLWFHPIKPLYCSLYDRDFWLHERFWKMNYNMLLVLFNGTPIKGFLLRMQGVQIGRNVFDDGAAFTEPSLVKVGDNCCFNFGSSVQCHSLEDGTFKSDAIKIGSDCNIDVRAFIHYGTRLHSGSTLHADSFLMKGSVIERDGVWYGNPAQEEMAEPSIETQMYGDDHDSNVIPFNPSELAQQA